MTPCRAGAQHSLGFTRDKAAPLRAGEFRCGGGASAVRKSGEEVVVAGGRERRIAERAGMDGNGVGEPERQVREIVGQDFLRFAAKRFPFFLIHFGANLVGERVDAWVAVVSAVGAVGREALRGVDELEDVRIVVGAYPAE